MDIGKVLAREGEWHTIDGYENVEVLIRASTPKNMRDLVKRFSKKIRVKGTVTEDYDWDQINYALVQDTVMDWKGIEQDGQPLPVSQESKRMLFDSWPAFNALCNAVWDTAKTTEAAEREADLGNLSTGQTSSLPATTA